MKAASVSAEHFNFTEGLGLKAEGGVGFGVNGVPGLGFAGLGFGALGGLGFQSSARCGARQS